MVTKKRGIVFLALLAIVFGSLVVSAASIERVLPNNVSIGDKITIELILNISEDYFIIEETVPSGFIISNVSNNGGVVGSTVRWLELSIGNLSKLSYDVITEDSEGTYDFSGRAIIGSGVDQSNLTVGGANYLFIESVSVSSSAGEDENVSDEVSNESQDSEGGPEGLSNSNENLSTIDTNLVCNDGICSGDIKDKITINSTSTREAGGNSLGLKAITFIILGAVSAIILFILIFLMINNKSVQSN